MSYIILVDCGSNNFWFIQETVIILLIYSFSKINQQLKVFILKNNSNN